MIVNLVHIVVFLHIMHDFTYLHPQNVSLATKNHSKVIDQGKKRYKM